MWFFSLLGFASLIWLLWIIGQNTGENLAQQREIKRELQQLNRNLLDIIPPPRS